MRHVNRYLQHVQGMLVAGFLETCHDQLCCKIFSLGEAGTAGLATKHVGGTFERCLWESPGRTAMSELLKGFTVGYLRLPGGRVRLELNGKLLAHHVPWGYSFRWTSDLHT